MPPKILRVLLTFHIANCRLPNFANSNLRGGAMVAPPAKGANLNKIGFHCDSKFWCWKLLLNCALSECIAKHRAPTTFRAGADPPIGLAASCRSQFLYQVSFCRPRRSDLTCSYPLSPDEITVFTTWPPKRDATDRHGHVNPSPNFDRSRAGGLRSSLGHHLMNLVRGSQLFDEI